ncbi:YkgB family protein [Myxococcus xanthus DZ2]|nr:YkgB family protein [Myxococcus xanthus]QVW72015.1 YkgB family protein [Myxococcus xanthus DZ2]UEO08505.1 YkgB family protein [Myxococcus xanthus DZ2]
MESLLRLAARADRIGMNVLRAGLIVVLVWIGSLKVAEYEADGIVPFVANSPVMSFVYAYDAPEYRQHMNAEGALVPANRAWHEANGTYGFSYLLGGVIVLFGLLIAAHWWRPELGAIGSALVIGMSVVTLSFLVTTPESWVPALGDAHHGFPWLSGRGRLVVKDAIMIGAAIVTMADSARVWLAQRKPQPAEQFHRAAA